MKKIVFVNSGIGIGGAERVISIWGNYFVKKFKVEIVTDSAQNSFYPLDDKIKTSILDYNINVPIIPFLRLFKMFDFLRKREGEVIIFNKYRYVTSLWIFRKFGFFKNIKLVYFAHGGIIDFINFYSKRRTKKIFDTFDEVICLFDGAEKEEKKDYIKYEKINIIPNPISFECKRPSRLNKKNFLYVGRLSEYPKGLDYLVKILEKTMPQLPKWKLKIVGDGEDRDKFKKILEEKDFIKNVEFLGSQKNVEKYYQEASVLILPSRYEGMPMVVLEAMECGVPVIAFDIDSTRNIIENGKNGFLASKYNIEDFSNYLIKLAEDEELRIKLGKEAKISMKEFTIESREKLWNKIIK